MMNPQRYVYLAAAFTLVVSSSAWCQSNTALPTDAQLLKARQRAADMLSRVPNNETVQRTLQAKPVMPKIEAMPKSGIASPDIASIAEKYKYLKQPRGIAGSKKNELMVFVSFSMPPAALERVISQAEKSGATLVFRGLKNDSMKQMASEIRKLLGKRKVGVVIHPPAFKQFSITQVPAVVIASFEAGNVMEDGCAETDTFVKVSGDVTLEYALEYIERNSAAWAPFAKNYLSSLKPELLK